MKKALRSFVTFSRAERLGIVSLSCVILSLLAIRISMPLWVHPPDHAKEDERLQAAWEHFKASHPANEQPDTPQHANSNDDYTDNGATLPKIININTADSATLVKLKGIGPAKAAMAIEHRRKKGPYKTVEEFRDAAGLSDNMFHTLKPHLAL